MVVAGGGGNSVLQLHEPSDLNLWLKVRNHFMAQ